VTLDQLALNLAEELERIAERPDVRTRERCVEIYRQRIRHVLGLAWRMGKRSDEDE
jgi:hypothetical protein